MSSQKLLLDRVEFTTIKVNADVGDNTFERNATFPQLEFDFSKVVFLTRSLLSYPPDEVADPQHFALSYGIRVEAKDQKDVTLPYSIEVEAVGFFRYTGGDEHVGVDRFRAVRFSGYQILYGAIREMVSNLTARGRHGIWQLPARNFIAVAKERAEDDERERQKLQTRLTEANSKKRARKRKLPDAPKKASLVAKSKESSGAS